MHILCVFMRTYFCKPNYSLTFDWLRFDAIILNEFWYILSYLITDIKLKIYAKKCISIPNVYPYLGISNYTKVWILPTWTAITQTFWLSWDRAYGLTTFKPGYYSDIFYEKDVSELSSFWAMKDNSVTMKDFGDFVVLELEESWHCGLRAQVLESSAQWNMQRL